MNFASKYSIGTRIGRGYSGIVFDCISRNNGDKYACKIIAVNKVLKEITEN